MTEKVLQNVTSKSRPTMEQLTKVMRIGHIDIATKWHELGPVLIDSYSIIRQIEADHRNDVATCCRKMFEKWLERTPDASWSQLVTALNETDMNTAADVISRQLNSDMQSAIEDAQSKCLVQFSTPDEASVEFGILLDEIVQELEKDESNNLRKLKTVSSTLTIQKASKVHVFTDTQLKEIQACNSVHTMLVYNLRHCYRWDDFSMLTILLSLMKSKACLNLLKKFEVKVNSKMKLKQIYEYCKQKSAGFSEEYHKIIAIVDDKIFSEITHKDYEVLKHFVSEQCGVEDYVISPVATIAISSLILEWYIPVTATAHMIKIALNNKGNFTKNCFVYLKISSTLILDYRDTTIERDQLFLAAKEGDVVTIKTLLNDKYIDVNVIKPREYCEDKWEREKTALHYGSQIGHAVVVEALIKAGADLNAVDYCKNTALHYGSHNGHAAVVEALIRAGADVRAVDDLNITALHYGSRNGHAAVVKALIRAGADVNAVDRSEAIALHYGSENGHAAVVEALIGGGADVNAVNYLKKTALHYGSQNGHSEVVETLIRAGAGVNYSDRWKKTALHYSSRNGHTAVVGALIRAGGDVNAIDIGKKTSLHYGSRHGHVVVVEALIRVGADVNAVDMRKNTALHYGSKNGHDIIAVALIRAGANVNAVGKFKMTALHYGTLNGQAVVVKALIEAGAVVNAVDYWRKIPLHYGAHKRNVVVVEALIRAGADINAVDDDVVKMKIDSMMKEHQRYLTLSSGYGPSSGYSASSGYGTLCFDSLSYYKSLMLLRASVCSNAKKKIMRHHGELRKLPVDLIWDKLLAKKVITHEEKETIENLPLQSDRIKHLLSSIIIPSLTDNIIEKFKGLLEVMEESGDQILIDMAKKLGGSK